MSHAMQQVKTDVDAFYAGIRSNDVAALAALVSEDFTLVWQGVPSIPWAGVWKGVPGLLEFFACLNAHIEVVSIEQVRAMSEFDCTVVLLRGHWRVRTSGVELEALAANMFEFELGKIKRYTVMNNSAAFDRALEV
jgi:ketosteroid isomerase-like protein